MVKNLTHFPLYLPSKGQFQEMDGEASHSVRHWLNREICNSAGGAFGAPSTWQQHLARVAARSLGATQ